MKSVVVLVGFEKVEGNSPAVLQDNLEEMLAEIPEDIDTRYCKAEVEDFEENEERGVGTLLVEFTITEANEEFVDAIDSEEISGASDEEVATAAESYLEKFFAKIRPVHEVDITIESSEVKDEADDEE